jgi:hypothetical protein
MRRSSLIVTLTAGFVAIVSAQFASAADLVPVTTSFDAKYANTVLHLVSRVFNGGFGLAEANRVNQDISALKADQSRTWRFTVQYHGKSEPLEIRAAMDDLGSIDLDFSASPDAAPEVRAAVDRYVNSRVH